MKQVISLIFSGYPPRLFFCTHDGPEVLRLACQVWDSVGGCQSPFSSYLGIGRAIRSEEVEVLRKLFMPRVEEQYFKNLTPEQVQELKKELEDDRVFLELAELPRKWSTNSTTEMLFELARMADSTIEYEPVQNITSIIIYD